GRGYLGGRYDAHRVRQSAVDGTNQGIGSDRARERKAGDLAKRVDAGIRASCASHRDVALIQLAQRVLEKTLDGRARRLALPADKRGAVVGDDDLECRHVARESRFITKTRRPRRFTKRFL